MEKVGIIVFAFGAAKFGAPKTIRSNLILAEIAVKKSKELKAAIFTQRDIVISEEMNVEYIKEKDKPPSTLKLAQAAVAWAIKNGIEEIIIVAAKPHLSRVLRDMRMAAKEYGARLGIEIAEEIFLYSSNDWFCPESIQLWTGNNVYWNIRENVLLYIPFPIYKIISRLR
jgi:uncharacterized SAM-binding protein YcdF (DUF218 family)